MIKKINIVPKGGFSFATISHDLPSGLVVFLVALPLCLGIALASGAPLFAGLISGIVGGVIVSVISGSQLAVSGPAAGLTVIVLSAIAEIGSFRGFGVAIMIGGFLQIILGFLKAGTIGNYFPSNVIKGMLAAIGIILIIKQIPHALGYDADYQGDFKFFQVDNENSFSAILHAVNKVSIGALIISIISLVIIMLWTKIHSKKIQMIPAPLIVVLVGMLLNLLFEAFIPELMLGDNHLVTIPVAGSLSEFISFFSLPDFSYITNFSVYKVGVTLAIVASLETLLSIEAIDKIDPHRRNTPPSHELKAQGVGNLICGLIGGLPITAVIVRGAANVNSGAQSKMSSFLHGIFLLCAALFFPRFINHIPMASLAVILLVTGYKLTNIKLYKKMFKDGNDQFIPFVVTVLAIVFTDLLIGIAIGLLVAGFIILKRNMNHSYSYNMKTHKAGDPVVISLSEEVSFLNKASILNTLNHVPEGEHVIIDGRKSTYIDYDVLEIIDDFKTNAKYKKITVELQGIKHHYQLDEDAAPNE